jgi:hypothetical protein
VVSTKLNYLMLCLRYKSVYHLFAEFETEKAEGACHDGSSDHDVEGREEDFEAFFGLHLGAVDRTLELRLEERI